MCRKREGWGLSKGVGSYKKRPQLLLQVGLWLRDSQRIHQETMAGPTTAASVTYLKWNDIYDEEKPFQILSDIPKGAKDQRTTNLEWESHEVSVQDVRGYEHQYSLDKHGFAFRTVQPVGMEEPDRRFIEQEYLPLMENLLKAELNDVQRVLFFDWRVQPNSTDSQKVI